MKEQKQIMEQVSTFNLNSAKVELGKYKINAPLIKPSKLTTVENGGIGKQLSDGWAINYAIGCMHGCRFCYVDAIHKRYGASRVGKPLTRAWGDYFYTPININEAIEETKWSKWKGEEAMMCSTHDPYLPQLLSTTRKILERALPEGVKFCVQTRSPLVMRDFDLFEKYKKQVRIQVSLSTINSELARAIEPRVAPPESRLKVLETAKKLGLDTGVIIAPIFPSVKMRPYPFEDMKKLIWAISKIRPDHIFGECLHIRGSNMKELEIALGERPILEGFDEQAEKEFCRLLKSFGLKGIWWKA